MSKTALESKSDSVAKDTRLVKRLLLKFSQDLCDAMGLREKSREGQGHPYLTGNFTPIQNEIPLTPCPYDGTIPDDLTGGEYVRNGGNPITNQDLGRDAHWFDGDGMLSGVLFRRSSRTGQVHPEFVNKYILTDVYLVAKSSRRLKTPILPSIATLVNPLSTFTTNIFQILRTISLVIQSYLPSSPQSIKKISVANTAFYYHDGRALATCESGPPMRIELPSLGTVGWYNGKYAEGESLHGHATGPVLGGSGVFKWIREWTTAHPRIDPHTKELILYQSCFIPPYVHYSIIQPSHDTSGGILMHNSTDILNRPIPGIGSPKMMHDFGVSSTHTVIMDLPLSLDPLNLLKGRPVVAYDASCRSRFGVFPRYRPQDIRWFETNACCIFHTANSWTSVTGKASQQDVEAVHMLCCRMTSAVLVFNAGNLPAPQPIHALPKGEEEQCRLYYYQFDISSDTGKNVILHQWALAAITFEFPTLRDSMSMSAAKYIYGCSVVGSSFGPALGRAAKMNVLAKMDVEILIAKGKYAAPTPIKGCVDGRDIHTIAASQDPEDPIKVFIMPDGWYAQEPRFVPRENGTSEDDGWILSYVFDEHSQLQENGEPKVNAWSELWIIDAKSMADIVAKIRLPQRVPYGLHGNWVSQEEIEEQRPIERLRSMASDQATANTS